MMGVFVVEMDNPTQAHDLYVALPENLRSGCELTSRMDGAQLRTPLPAAADWIAEHYQAARAA